jgi:nitroimidazol reductase NimA-like FMN-containing flavoprotein (pyridoxamine 5'-phosphate oxidase superfamily)
MEIDRNGLEVLTRDDCLTMLATATIGRLGLCMGALPVVLPVNFALSDHGIVIRTRPGSKLDAATANAVVAFEVDDFDAMYHAGWSVAVTGVARELSDPAELAWAERLPLAPWAIDDPAHFVCISTDVVTGRRIRRDAPRFFVSAGRAS